MNRRKIAKITLPKFRLLYVCLRVQPGTFPYYNIFLDPCMQCKPRFACEGVNLGSSMSSSCRCKAGWAGNGNLCLPQKKVNRADLAPQNKIHQAAPQVAATMHNGNNVKKSSSGFAALNALTASLNKLKSETQKKLHLQVKV